MRFALKAIGTYIPERRLDNAARAEKFGTTEAFLRDKLGPRWLARKDDDEETSDLGIRAISNIAVPDFDGTNVDALIVCTQNPDGHGLPHTSAIMHGKLGMKSECAAFDVSLGCSGYVYGLGIAGAMAQTYGFRNLLLVTSDPYSKIINDDDKDTALLFGDAATATWISQVSEPDQNFLIGPVKFATNGAGAKHLEVGPDGFLKMHGREVFSFTAVEVPRQISQLLSEAGLAKEEIDRFVLHQGSKYILRTIQERMNLPEDKVPIGLEQMGNTISSSIPLILSGLLDDRTVRRAVLSGFGVGLSMASMLVTRD